MTITMTKKRGKESSDQHHVLAMHYESALPTPHWGNYCTWELPRTCIKVRRLELNLLPIGNSIAIVVGPIGLAQSSINYPDRCPSYRQIIVANKNMPKLLE